MTRHVTAQRIDIDDHLSVTSGGVARLRLCHVLLEVIYLGGRLADDAYEALAAALRAIMPGEVSCTVATGLRDVLKVNVTVRAPHPVAALAEVNAALDRALMSTGLFEEFDVTGKTVHAAPAETSK